MSALPARPTKAREHHRRRAVRLVRRQDPRGRSYSGTILGDESVIVDVWGEHGTIARYRVRREAIT